MSFDTRELVKTLRTGADISRTRNLNLDYAEIADKAADLIEYQRNLLIAVQDFFDGQGYTALDVEQRTGLPDSRCVEVAKAITEFMNL